MLELNGGELGKKTNSVRYFTSCSNKNVEKRRYQIVCKDAK